MSRRSIPPEVQEQINNRHTKDKIVSMYKTSPVLKSLSESQAVQLYTIVLCEHEGYDGEPVDTKFVIMDMERRYKNCGLTPSRN